MFLVTFKPLFRCIFINDLHVTSTSSLSSYFAASAYFSLYDPSHSAGLPDCILCPYRDVVNEFQLVIEHLPVSTVKGASLKLVDKFTYLRSSVSSTENGINMRLAKTWSAIDRLSVMWKSDLSDKIKRNFFQGAVVSILLHMDVAIISERSKLVPREYKLVEHEVARQEKS